MAPAITAVNTVISSPAATVPALQVSELTPGTLIAARVLAILDDNTVELAVGNSLLAASTQVPLTPGATVQLAVEASDNGTTLRLVGQSAPAIPPSAVVAAPQTAPSATTSAAPLATDDPAAAAPIPPVTPINDETATVGRLTPTGLATIAAPPLAAAAAADPSVALTVAVRSAAVTQNGLAPLFAEAAAAVDLPALPQPIRQQLAGLLALRPPLDDGLTAADIRRAFAQSGLFFETELAQDPGATGPGLAARSGNAAGVPTSAAGSGGTDARAGAASAAPPASDLKAALIVLRQVLATALPQNGARSSDALPTGAEPEAPTADVATVSAGEAAVHGGPGAAPTSAAPPPPPPFRGALPSAQPAASPTITTATPPQAAAKLLITATEAALARQTLLQAASLPNQPAGSPTGPPAPHLDDGGPRWNFEVPFATPQGTRIAQFEISRDGRGNQPAAPVQPLWRARFSIDIDPLGPVHAQVSLQSAPAATPASPQPGLTGARATVTLWAERPEAAARLRAGAATLAAALRGVDLDAGDLVVRDGAPKRSGAPVPAGRFLDRAL